ncbi:MAG TPA: GspH/FimT family protein [Phycisphaerae bacterium]|nr:GspH/FimT family protein [Phycisphaerae bacterium]
MKSRRSFHSAAFTLVELLIVIMILAIAAAIVVPNLGTAADSQVVSAARVLESDLGLARSLALTTQQTHSVVFSPDLQSYKVVADYGGGAYAAAVAVEHPVRVGARMETTLKKLGGMGAVVVAGVSFGGGATYVTFNSLGEASSAGSITLQAGGTQMVISVESLTGAVTVQRTAG